MDTVTALVTSGSGNEESFGHRIVCNSLELDCQEVPSDC